MYMLTMPNFLQVTTYTLSGLSPSLGAPFYHVHNDNIEALLTVFGDTFKGLKPYISNYYYLVSLFSTLVFIHFSYTYEGGGGVTESLQKLVTSLYYVI